MEKENIEMTDKEIIREKKDIIVESKERND
jgi:hypothetical protein